MLISKAVAGRISCISHRENGFRSVAKLQYPLFGRDGFVVVLSHLAVGAAIASRDRTLNHEHELAFLLIDGSVQDVKGNITRSSQEAGLTRYHLRELLKRHGIVYQGS